MGIFDKLAGTKKIQLTPKSALVAAAITVIASDGFLDDQELFDLQKIVRGDQNAVDAAMKVLQVTKFPEISDMIAGVLNEKQRLATMAILLDLAMADGLLVGNEQKTLQMYIEKFGISEDELKPLIETIALKNDFSVFS